MKLANLDDRLVLVVDDGVADVATVSNGRFGPDPMSAFDAWTDFVQWAAGVTDGTDGSDGSDGSDGTDDIGQLESRFRCPVPRPRQVFAIGLNYRSHAEESKMAIPEVPATFTKFPASLGGPFDDIEIVGDAVDWEVELVAVIGVRADHVVEADAWRHVAGLTVGQDVSDRTLQFAAGMQFSLGKSRRGYGPMGPWVVTPEEVPDPDDLRLGCAVDGETVQDARTSDLIFSVPRLIVELSSVLPLLPGDLIFTGTPAGVGMARQPPRSLLAGQILESWVEGLGTIRNRCVKRAT
jgi:2,4-didehydro-3-deoxy-L-rhamnonate hydrolase